MERSLSIPDVEDRAPSAEPESPPADSAAPPGPPVAENRPERVAGPGRVDRPDRGARPDRPPRSDRPDRATGVVRAREVAPEPPDEAQPELLDPLVRRDLRSLTGPTADRVARHLVAAAMNVDGDPSTALAHARAARSLAARIASVREAAGLAAYHAGEYAEAIAELRAARRIDGSARHLPVIADAERGLGRPERALALASDPGAADLDDASRVELAIVLSGARRDLGQHEAAVVMLQGPDLSRQTVESWTPRLWYAYAEALLAAGRPDDAVRWFTSVAAVDDGATDAAERLADIEDA
ncbi:MAG: tetratricopeptide repeat protein [Frankia sp.]